ncbi:MAG: thymidine phosphorylase [Spirochaetaceae bacterium]|nr:MAG: thymidine phosphorylase [Spirochaetaceae bacterium]
MRAVDLVVKKRDGGTLSREEIACLIDGYVAGSVPEYQIAAWLMAVYFSGMSRQETGHLTDVMIRSGTVFDLSGIDGPFVDKHSTGGVGDKVSLILAPVVAACGVRVPMMSGRALGHTGGTLDKLEAIEGYTTALPIERFCDVLRDVGYAMTGQSRDVVPADRLLYALRDVTGTVESVPLITASILSKKFAEGSDALVFDVKCGSGAFMKTRQRAHELAESLVETATALGKRVVAVLTRMEQPLGHMVGNFLEVEESIACLRGTVAGHDLQPDPRSADLMEVTLRLAAWMLVLGGACGSVDEGTRLAQRCLEDGSAWERFVRNVELQGGRRAVLEQRYGSFRASERHTITASESGRVQQIDAYKVGMAGVYLGVGRNTADDAVLPHVGIDIHRKRGDGVSSGDALCTVYAENAEALRRATPILEQAFVVGADQVDQSPMILEEITNL